MARTFRLWQKKRGGRRTGSRLAGSLGEAVFFGILFLLGAISLTAVLTSQVMNPTPEIYRFGFGFWLMVLVMASFALIGGIGVVWSAVYAGTSAERRSALVKHAVGMELISEAMPTSLEFPNIPRDAYLTNSPGVKLKYRLPTEQAPVWRLAVSALIFLVSTGVTSVLIVILVNQHMAGTPDWFLTLFAAPLILANLWCVRYFFSELRRQTRFGPTCIEISNHPLRPNSECEIFVTQAGRLSLKSLVLSLVCERRRPIHKEQIFVQKPELSHGRKSCTRTPPGSKTERARVQRGPGSSGARHAFAPVGPQRGSLEAGCCGKIGTVRHHETKLSCYRIPDLVTAIK